MHRRKEGVSETDPSEDHSHFVDESIDIDPDGDGEGIKEEEAAPEKESQQHYEKKGKLGKNGKAIDKEYQFIDGVDGVFDPRSVPFLYFIAKNINR